MIRAWVNVFGGMTTLILDGKISMRGNEVDGLAMCSQVSMNHKAPHQQAWQVERHNASIRSALQRAEGQVIKEALRISFTTVLGLCMCMHNALVLRNNHTPYRAIFGRQPRRLQPLEGGRYGGAGVKVRHEFVRVRAATAVAIIEATAKQRLARGDERNQTAVIERAEHQPGDLVDIWNGFFNDDIPGWRCPAQIATVKFDQGNVTARPRGKTLDRRGQEVRAHVPYLVHPSIVVGHDPHHWNIVQRVAEVVSTSFLTVSVVYQQCG